MTKCAKWECNNESLEDNTFCPSCLLEYKERKRIKMTENKIYTIVIDIEDEDGKGEEILKHYQDMQHFKPPFRVVVVKRWGGMPITV